MDIRAGYMPSQSDIKLFSSLKLKKFRQKYGLFLVEGVKSVQELRHSQLNIRHILVAAGSSFRMEGADTVEISARDMERISAMETPPGVIAVVEIPATGSLADLRTSRPLLALDGIRDPGNLGTIIRIADWYGLSHVLLSEDCTDLYNPKCLQASMGSFMRVSCIYGKLDLLLRESGLPVYACTLHGQNIREMQLPERCIMLIGSDAHGISAPLLELADGAITIPRFGQAESLNAAIATALVLDRCVR